MVDATLAEMLRILKGLFARYSLSQLGIWLHSRMEEQLKRWMKSLFLKIPGVKDLSVEIVEFDPSGAWYIIMGDISNMTAVFKHHRLVVSNVRVDWGQDVIHERNTELLKLDIEGIELQARSAGPNESIEEIEEEFRQFLIKNLKRLLK